MKDFGEYFNKFYDHIVTLMIFSAFIGFFVGSIGAEWIEEDRCFFEKQALKKSYEISPPINLEISINNCLVRKVIDSGSSGVIRSCISKGKVDLSCLHEKIIVNKLSDKIDFTGCSR